MCAGKFNHINNLNIILTYANFILISFPFHINTFPISVIHSNSIIIFLINIH